MLRASAILLIVLTGPIFALALSPVPTLAQAHVARTLRDFDHASWTLKEGAPAGIWSIAQSRDGWLWLGTSSGLFRFDGVSFERHDLLPPGSLHSRSIFGIYPMDSGDIWVTYSAGGASVIRANSPVTPLMPAGLPEGTPIEQIFADANGQVLATTGNAIFRYSAERWILDRDSALGLPPVAVMALHDVGEGVWVATEAGLYRMRQGEKTFQKIAPLGRSGNIVSGVGGDVWQSHSDGLSKVVKGHLATQLQMRPSLVAEAGTAVMTPDGAWWSIACEDAGVCRTENPSQSLGEPAVAALSVDELTESEGLSGMSMTLLLDREGTVWVGTKNGLDRFRPRALSIKRFKEPALYFAMVPDSSGGLWLGTASMGFRDLWRHIDQHKEYIYPDFKADVTAAYRDNDGSILLGGTKGLWRFQDNRMTPVQVPADQLGSRLQTIARDGIGRLWISFRNFPVFQLDGPVWKSKGGLSGLPDNPVAVAVSDPAGSVWFGYTSNMLLRLQGNRISKYGEQNGLTTGTVTAIVPDEKLFLVGGEQGLAALIGERFQSLQVARPELLTGITGMLRSRDGTLWINGNGGALRIDGHEVQKAIADPHYLMVFRLFDGSDGMPGGAQQGRPLPTLVQASDGHIWFAATNGLASIDPTTFTRNLRPPTLAIRTFTAAKKSYPLASPVKLPADARELRIGYSALDLAMPDKFQFRYRLIGSDGRWEEVGTRREAFYTNLEPGHYRFELQAANEDGVWSRGSTTFEFDIARTFTETWSFKAICLATAAAFLWLLYRFRIRQSRRQLRRQIEARNAERERIARDLHDTLLQGIQGLLLRLQTWAADRALAPSHRADMSAAAENAHDMLVEGRDRIIELRRSDSDQIELSTVLRSLGEAYASRGNARFEFKISGEQRKIAAEAVQEIIDIAREGLRNAFTHSKAATIQLHIEYRRSGVAISVLDDGIGLAASFAEAGKPGHWGIPGMKERASRLNGQLVFNDAKPHGTQLLLHVPASIAYSR